MSSIPHPVQFVVFIGIVVSINGMIGAPNPIARLIAGLVSTLILALVVGVVVRLRARRRQP